MARYTAAVCRLCRRNGEKLMLKGSKCIVRCTLDKRSKPPGQQSSRRRPRLSERGLQLREKQKARYSYGLLEKQFRRLFAEAERQTGITGENLLVLLERRLDNVVYRLGFADSRVAVMALLLLPISLRERQNAAAAGPAFPVSAPPSAPMGPSRSRSGRGRDRAPPSGCRLG